MRRLVHECTTATSSDAEHRPSFIKLVNTSIKTHAPLENGLGRGLEGVEEDVEGLAFDSVVLDNDARAADDLSGGAFRIELAQTGPFAEGHLRVNLHQMDLVVSAKCLDEFTVLLLVAVLGEHAQVSESFVKGLGGFVETTGETIVDKGVLENLVFVRFGSDNSHAVKRWVWERQFGEQDANQTNLHAQPNACMHLPATNAYTLEIAR